MKDTQTIRPFAPASMWVSIILAVASSLLSGCHQKQPVTIAVIPRIAGGTALWDPVYSGALTVARSRHAAIYWNAPTREDDIQGQIAMVDRLTPGKYSGLVLAPDHALALITPVRRALARGLPIVIIGSPLAIPSSHNLGYILNNEEAGGRIAADRVAFILHGHGSIAVLGIDPDISGIVQRANSFEAYLASHYPQVRIVEKRVGSFNVPHEEQMAEETLKAHPGLDVIVALTSTSAHEAISAIGDNKLGHVHVIAFDPDLLLLDNPNLDSLILENTSRMGADAVQDILLCLQGHPMPPPEQLDPVLVTRQNIDTPAIRNLTPPIPLGWKWSVGP